MKTPIIFLLLVFSSTAAVSQWRDVGLGKPNDLHTQYALVAFGALNTTLFVSFPQPGGGVFRFGPPNGWVETDSGIDFSKGDINLFASIGPYLYASPGTARLNLSTDNGSHWNKANVAGPPYSNGTYLFGSLGSSIARSRDSGKTWELVATISATGFASFGAYTFATSDVISRSSDSGSTWEPTTSTFVGPMTVLNSLLFVTAKGSVRCSRDSGTSWSTITIPRRTVNALAAKNSYLFAGTDSGVFVSLDSGANWRNVSDGMMTVGPQYYPDCTALCVFDTMLFVDINAGPATGYIVARPISEMIPKSGVGRVASVPELDSLEVYPNPASGLITIRGSYSVARVSVLNVLGAEVLNMPNIRESELTLDLSHFASGTYFLRIETAKGVVMRKVVRE